MPNKPRNALGFAKDIALSEMQALLLASFPVTDERLRQLALQRGLLVRDGSIAKGVPNSRIFMVAPNLTSAAAQPADSPAASWVPQVAPKLAAK